MLKKIFITNIIIICGALAGYCFSEDNISALEYSKYGQAFNNESLSERLSRLETDIFGMEQSGDLDTRLANLGRMSSTVIQNPSAIFDNNLPYPGKKKSAIRNFLDNVSSTFTDTGTFTGFTPSMTYGGIYDNQFSGLTGGSYYSSNYCPYRYNGINNFNRFNNGFNYGLNNRIMRNHFNNRYNRFHGNLHRPTYNNYPGPRFSPYNRIYNSNRYTRPYRPQNIATNFTTGSTVRILRDWFYKIKYSIIIKI